MNVDTGNRDPDELEDLFFWLQRVLQKYAENPGCAECLRLTREGLAQIRPRLDAARRDDVVQLCEEMHRVVHDLETERIRWTEHGAELLVRAALQLSGPLGLTGAAPEHLARVLLPLVNELRALRGAGRLMTPAIVLAAERAQPEPAVIPVPGPGAGAAESTPVASGASAVPGVSAASGASVASGVSAGEGASGGEGADGADAGVWLHSLRGARGEFQRGLLDLLQGQDPTAAARRIEHAAAAIAETLHGSAGQLLFRATARLAGTLAGTLAGDAAAVAPPIRQLLGRVDRHLGDGLQMAERIQTEGAGPAATAFPVDAGLLLTLDAATDALERGVTSSGLAVSGVGQAGLVAERHAVLQWERTPLPTVPGVGSGQPAPAPAAGLDYDRELLQARVLALGIAVPSPGFVEAVETDTRNLRATLSRWQQNPRDAVLAAAMEERFRALREQARSGGAPRLGEFAWVLESFLAARGVARAADVEAMQVIEDAVNVLPDLLEELRTGGAPETPVADIVLRIEAMLAEGSGSGDGDDEGPEPAAQDDAALDRIRSKGGAEMARLAAAFAALDDAAPPGVAAGAAPEAGTASDPSDTLAVARARAAEIAAWHQRVVDALTQAASQTQALERVLGRLRGGPGSAGVGDMPPPAPGARVAGIDQALEELELLRLSLGAAIGNASAALLQQRRATQALQDRLAAGAQGTSPLEA